MILLKGKLYTRKRKNSNNYSVYLHGKEKWITRDHDLVEKYKLKDMLEKEILCTQNICTSLSEIISDLPNYNFSDPISTQWENEKYIGNSYKNEQLEYMTLKGHPVRSKSERFIADTLFSLNIPYRYEFPLYFEGQKVHPDFILIKPNGEYIIWEHFGLLDNEEYLNKAIKKIKLYKRNGFSQHQNLICTTEADLKDKSVIEDIIQRFYFS